MNVRLLSIALLALGAIWLAAPGTIAQIPDDYYADAEGLTRQALKEALHEIIDDHTAHSYSAAREYVQLLDEDPDDENNVVLIYSRASVPKATWPDFNREHLWPQSLGARWFPAKSDMHHIFAADAGVNSSRGNKPFDDCVFNCRTHAKAPSAPYDSDSWEPPDDVKGNIARALFYMDVRYEGDNAEPDLDLTNEMPTSGCDCMGMRDTLLEWHRLDPVDDAERRRNDMIFNDIQGNRNPFIDHPEWVSAVYEGQEVKICSFNIQFLGNSADRDDAALASVLEDCDIAVIQELVSPPYPGEFPNGDAFNPDPQSAEFFDEMAILGFDYVLSEEDTGTGNTIHRNGSSTEWWVAFYNPESVQVADDLPSGFLADDRANHDDYERVPYAFAFSTLDELLDFVLISVHLKPGSSQSNADRRAHELEAIAAWIDDNDEVEHDFIILGDMNIEDAQELAAATPVGFESLNDACLATNTNVNGPKPYDHVMLDPTSTTELISLTEEDERVRFGVIDLIEAMRPFWDSSDPYPGADPYDHNAFRRYYSDHHPVYFKLVTLQEDDD